ncbi:hypothetical protein ACA910_015834 [Epithemia clementina (nom. ined.)]
MADDMGGFGSALDPVGGGGGARDNVVEGIPDKTDSSAVIHQVFQETTKLVIKQKFEALEALANAAANAVGMGALGALGEIANKYDAYTDDGGLKFRVVESSEYCGLTGRCCCKPNHKLQLHVYHEGEEVVYIDRGCKCGQCCSFHECCRQEMTVYQGPGEGSKLGHIMEPTGGGGFSPTLQVMDRDENQVATIKAKAFCCIGGICCDHTFEITDAQGNVVGKIIKTKPDSLGAFAKEMVSDADVFSMDIPKEMAPEQKAAMLASLHLIDYWLFEGEGDFVCDIVNQSCSVKCCDLYCFGCVWPCSCTCDFSGDGGDGGDGGGD